MQVTISTVKPRGRGVIGREFTLPGCPQTTRELICALVQQMVEDFNRRASQGTARPLSEADLADREELGKIAFGIPLADRKADPQKAINTALQGFSDGLYRIYHKSAQLTELDSPIRLQENDELTFIRLVMLTGGWY